MKNAISRSLAAVHTHTDTSSKIKNLVNNKIKINKIYSKSYAGNNYKIAGITLIALVITIVILIILAGISIVAIRNTKIVDRAKETKNKTEIATIEEQMKLLESDWQVEKNADNNKNFEEFLKEKQQEGKIERYEIKENKNKEKSYIVYNNEYSVEFNSNGVISGTIEKENDSNYITAKTIADEKDKSKYYGKIVKNYECTNKEAVNEWKIFYSDGNNIYLIAGDFINYKYCPPGKNGTAVVSKGATEYDVKLDNLADYTGSNDITDERIKNLNKNYFDYLKNNSTSNNDSNLKAIAYLLDTNVWKNFVGNNAEYAIGSPTYELIFASYNQTHGTDYQTRVINYNGYQIRLDNNSNWSSDAINLDANDNIYGELYVIKEVNKAETTYIASPNSSGYLPNLINSDYPEAGTSRTIFMGKKLA